MFTHRLSRLVLVLLFTSAYADAQDVNFFQPDSIRRRIKAIPIASNLVIDGKLNEVEWALPSSSPQFIQIEPKQGPPSSFLTEVKVLYNRKNLYVGIVCHDPLGKRAIRATDFIRDFDVSKHDLVGLSFDPFDDNRNAMAFATNAYGVQRDLLSFDDLYYDLDWDGLWQVRTTRSDSGWTAEIAIPWKTLRYPRTTDSIQHWGFNVYRNRRSTNEISAFSPFPRVFSATRMDYAGELTNLRPPPATTNIRFEPYLLMSRDHYSYFNPVVNPDKQATNFKAGGDLKWGLSPNAILDLTANTDFAQSDVDLQVNNTTQFSIFYPEKRQFFLENASLFGVNVGPGPDGNGGQMRYQPFFSRQIGLDSTGNPIPILGGGRFVYRSSSLNFGAMAIRQAGEDRMPGTNFFIGRVSQNFGSQNRIGALITVKNEPTGSNMETTADGFFRLGGSHSINTILTESITTQTGKCGFGGIIQYYYQSNHWKVWLTESVVTPNFDPQLGFVSRTNVIGTTPGFNWYYRGKSLPFKSKLRGFEPSFVPEIYYTASTGRFAELDLPFVPLWLNFQNGAFLGVGFTSIRQHLSELFQPLGVTIKAGNYSYLQKEVYFGSDPSKFVNVYIHIKDGTYFDGRASSIDLKLQFAPIPYISLSGEFNSNHFDKVGVQRITQTTNLFIVQSRLAVNPRMQVTGVYQKNSLNNSDSYNIRFSWEFKPLSNVYLIYNHGNTGLSGDLVKTPRDEDHEIAKISYLRQF